MPTVNQEEAPFSSLGAFFFLRSVGPAMMVACGGRLLDGLLYGQLERHGRGWTAVAAPLQPHPREAVLEAQKFHVTTVGFEVRAYFIQGSEYPALYVHRVQAVQEQQVCDQVVVQELVLQFGAAQTADALYDAPQALAVELQKHLHHLRGLRPRFRVFEGLDLFQQRLYPADALRQLLVV